MPILAANASVDLGQFPRGATLTIAAIPNVGVGQFPYLNDKVITLSSNQPKIVTLAQKTDYTLKAHLAPINYSVKAG